MTTRLHLRTALRLRLEDSSGSPLWDDATLNDALTGAMRSYGARFPMEQVAAVEVTAGAARIAVAAPVIEPERIVRVLDERGDTVPRYEGLDADLDEAASQGTVAQAWRWWNATLILHRPAPVSGNWTVEYLDGRALPADDVTAVEVLPGDEEIVIALAAATALRRRAVEDGKRGARSGLAPLAEAARIEARRLIAARRRRARGGRLG